MWHNRRNIIGVGADVVGAGSGMAMMVSGLGISLTTPATGGASSFVVFGLMSYGAYNATNSVTSLISRFYDFEAPGLAQETRGFFFGEYGEMAGASLDQFGTVNGLMRNGLDTVSDILSATNDAASLGETLS